MIEKRSNCPISFTLDLIGDKWSLLILRDLLFKDKSSYQEFLDSDESIATNILANRLKKLEELDMLVRVTDPANRRKVIYFPTQKSIDLLPVLLEMILWGANYDRNTAAPKSEIAKIKKNKQQYLNNVAKKLLRRLNENNVM